MFLSRCLIYKVHALAFRPAVLFILAHSFELVKYFFQKFFNFLPKRSHSSPRSRFVELVHFTTLFRVCQELFSRFFAVFIPLSLDFKLFSDRSASHANSFILTRAFRFVKHFFQKSFGSPSRFPSVSSKFHSVFVPSREVLGYYISLFSLCQHSFSNFFDFLERSS